MSAEGAVRVWSVRFPWWGLAPFGDVGSFAGRQWAPAGEVFDADLVAGVLEAVASEQPVEGLNRVLLAHLLAWTVRPNMLRDAGRSITRHVAELTVDELAAASSRSRRQFQRDFRRVLDATPVPMIARVRFERARRPVMNERIPLTRVGAEAGYPDQSHLNRAFHKFARMTPLEYRRQTAGLPLFSIATDDCRRL